MKTDDGREIVFFRQDGIRSENLVRPRGVDKDTGEIIFFELLGYSGEVKGGTRINGRQTYKRLFIQRVYPAIEINN